MIIATMKSIKSKAYGCPPCLSTVDMWLGRVSNRQKDWVKKSEVDYFWHYVLTKSKGKTAFNEATYSMQYQ